MEDTFKPDQFYLTGEEIEEITESSLFNGPIIIKLIGVFSQLSKCVQIKILRSVLIDLTFMNDITTFNNEDLLRLYKIMRFQAGGKAPNNTFLRLQMIYVQYMILKANINSSNDIEKSLASINGNTLSNHNRTCEILEEGLNMYGILEPIDPTTDIDSKIVEFYAKKRRCDHRELVDSFEDEWKILKQLSANNDCLSFIRNRIIEPPKKETGFQRLFSKYRGVR